MLYIYKQKTVESKAQLGKIDYVEEYKEELETKINYYTYLPTYGSWEVTKIAGRSEQAYMKEEEINKLIGTDIKLHQRYIKINGKLVAEDYKVKIDTIPILIEDQVHMKGFPSLKELGITEDYFVFIEIVSDKDNEVYREPLRKFYVKNADTLIVEEQGYYLELKKVKEPKDLYNFYEFG